MEPRDFFLSSWALQPQGDMWMGTRAGCAWPVSPVTSLSFAKGEAVSLDDLGVTWMFPTLFAFPHAQLLHCSQTCLVMVWAWAAQKC